MNQIVNWEKNLRKLQLALTGRGRGEVKNVASYKYDSIVWSWAVPSLGSPEKKEKLFFYNQIAGLRKC